MTSKTLDDGNVEVTVTFRIDAETWREICTWLDVTSTDCGDVARQGLKDWMHNAEATDGGCL